MRSFIRAPSRPPTTGSLASSDASTTPAWQATTTSSPGWRAATESRASDTRLTNPVQLSPPGAMTRSGSASQSGLPNRALKSPQSRPSASPQWSSQKPHSCTGSTGAPSPGARSAGARIVAVSTARGSTLE